MKQELMKKLLRNCKTWFKRSTYWQVMEALLIMYCLMSVEMTIRAMKMEVVRQKKRRRVRKESLFLVRLRSWLMMTSIDTANELVLITFVK